MEPMFSLSRLRAFRLSVRQYVSLMLYTLALASFAVIIHEMAHIISAMFLGVPLVELQLGFMGINPSITMPEWFTGTRRMIVYYAGGLTAGVTLLLLYMHYWRGKYRRQPTFFHWSMGLVTSVLAAVQFAYGYLEGNYHGAYIIGAMSFLSSTDLLAYGWAVSAIFFHSALCPWRKMSTICLKS